MSGPTRIRSLLTLSARLAGACLLVAAPAAVGLATAGVIGWQFDGACGWPAPVTLAVALLILAVSVALRPGPPERSTAGQLPVRRRGPILPPGIASLIAAGCLVLLWLAPGPAASATDDHVVAWIRNDDLGAAATVPRVRVTSPKDDAFIWQFDGLLEIMPNPVPAVSSASAGLVEVDARRRAGMDERLGGVALLTRAEVAENRPGAPPPARWPLPLPPEALLVAAGVPMDRLTGARDAAVADAWGARAVVVNEAGTGFPLPQATLKVKPVEPFPPGERRKMWPGAKALLDEAAPRLTQYYWAALLYDMGQAALAPADDTGGAYALVVGLVRLDADLGPTRSINHLFPIFEAVTDAQGRTAYRVSDHGNDRVGGFDTLGETSLRQAAGLLRDELKTWRSRHHAAPGGAVLPLAPTERQPTTLGRLLNARHLPRPPHFQTDAVRRGITRTLGVLAGLAVASAVLSAIAHAFPRSRRPEPATSFASSQ